MGNTPKQRKTVTLLMLFFMFFVAAAAGTVSREVTVATIIMFLIAVSITVPLAVLQRRIWLMDRSKVWVRSTMAVFTISAFLGLGLAAERLVLGIFSFGLVGLICTTIQLITWKTAKFFREHTNPLPGSNTRTSHDIRDIPKEGRAYINRFDQLYDEIPSFKKPPISKQAQHIREVYIQTHGVLSKNPELTSAAHELMDYHFPQALKLLETYGDFTKKKVKVENIEQILDNLVQSFDALSGAVNTKLNDLYAGIVLDVKTDMAVTKNMK